MLLGILVVLARWQWTPGGRFGAANAVTAARLGLLGLFPFAAEQGAKHKGMMNINRSPTF